MATNNSQPSVQDTLQDPDFLALPMGEQQKVLQQIDQNFAGLPQGEQVRVLVKVNGQGQGAPLTEAQAANSTHATQQAQSAVQNIVPSTGRPTFAAQQQQANSPDYWISRARATMAPQDAAKFEQFVRQNADWQPNAAQSLIMGAGKEAVRTGEGLKSLVNKVLPNGLQIPTLDSVEPLQGVAEHIGGLGENVAEWAAGEGALKGLGKLATVPESFLVLLEKYPKASKLITSVLSNAAIGGTQGAVKGAASGEALPGAAGGAIGGALGGTIAEATGAALSKVSDLAAPVKKLLGFGLTSEEALTKAGRPAVTDYSWQQNLQTAMPRILQATEEDGSNFKNVGQFVDFLHDTANDIRQNEFNPMIKRNAKQMVSAQPVAANIRAAITPQMQEYAPQEAEELKDFAVKFAKDMPLGKAEQDLQYFNAQLKAFYKANAVNQNAALQTSGTVAKYEAAADGLRDLIYGKLRELGENVPEQLQKQYGALKSLERTFAKRATVSDRQAPLNLQQVLTLAGGAGEAAGALLSGHPAAALAGAVPIAISTAARHGNLPETLINRGIETARSKAVPAVRSAFAETAQRVSAASGAKYGADRSKTKSTEGNSDE